MARELNPSHPSSPAHDGGTLTLPVLVFGLTEVRRLRREMDMLDDFLHQAKVRQPGTAVTLPKMSRLLEALASENHINLLQAEHRKALQAFLEQIEKRAPRLHFSFAVDPSASFTVKVVTWLRRYIHPYTLVQLGLQPTIAAGCVVRAPNKVFDFSLRNRFREKRQLLIDALSGKH